MTSIEQKIQDASATNKELLGLLADTDYAPPALAQQERYVADLHGELQKLAKEISRLENVRQKELKDHEKYRDSVMKRFAYKVTRKEAKYDAKASKEEKEYFAALQSEHRAKEARASTQQTFNEAQNRRSELVTVVDKHQDAQRQLDALYNSIFEGPTPGFAEEDDKERAAKSALQTYQDTRRRCDAESQALKILNTAVQRMNASQGCMAEARSHSRMDMFGGGTMTDMMERSALHKAEQQAMEAQMLVMQAQRLSPHVESIPRPSIAQGNLMADVFFDNIFSDMDFHEKIKASELEVHQSAKAAENQARLNKVRLDEVLKQSKQHEKELEAARATLQKAREHAFEQITSGGGATGSGGLSSNATDAPPPAYKT